jgi:hypothetical protein
MKNTVRTILIAGIAGLAVAGCSQEENNVTTPEATETAVMPLPGPTETEVMPVPGATATETVAPDPMATETTTTP